jgi:xylulokinase
MNPAAYTEREGNLPPGLPGGPGPLLFCADIGTSSLKAALIDTRGVLYAYAREAYDVYNVPAPASWEAAFYRAWDAFAPLVRDAGPPAAIIISGNGPTLVPVTENGDSLVPIFWFDPVKPCPGIRSFFLPRVKAFEENRQEDHKRTKIFLSSQEWLSWRIGAEPVTAVPHAAYEPYYWDDAQCAALDLDRGKFTPFVKMGSVIGRTAGGIPVAAAGPDFIMALIGTGVLEPGMACDRAGSSEGINVCTASPGTLPAFPLRVLPHAAEGLWNVGAVIARSGKLLDEFMKSPQCRFQSREEVLEEFISNPGSPGGAALKEIVLQFASALDALEAAGFPLEELVLSGGQAKSPLWNQYKADYTGRTLLEPEIIDAELCGNAVLGALILEGGTLREKAAGMIRIKKRYTPARKSDKMFKGG